MTLPSGSTALVLEIKALKEQLAAMTQENEEQARLLGISGSKEARLIAELVAMTQERDGWISSAKEFSNGMEYYRGQLDACARHIGLPCFTADDGGVHPEPLRAKVAECVGELQAQLAASQALEAQLREALEKVLAQPAVALRTATKALALPQDDTALREWGAKLLEEMADEHYEKWSINHGILTAKAAELEAGKCAT